MFSLRNRYALGVMALVLLAAGVLWFRMQTGNAVAALAPPPDQAVAVDVVQVNSRSITDWREYSGRLEAVDQVRIRPLVSGTITQVHFEDGSLVQEGDVLFTIDPRPYQAAVDRAQADLAAAKARMAYTGADLARARRLLDKNAIAKRDFEQKRNASRVAAAEKQAAETALATAELDLEHTQIVAPVSGRVSRAEVTEGNIVSAGTGAQPLTTLVSIDKMYASFEVDEQSFLSFVNPARIGGAEQIAVNMGLGNERGFPRRGKVASIDNRLDASSGTIRLRAVFDNADGMLLPGLYARIQLVGGAPRPAVLIKESAIGTDQSKRFVVVVDGQNRTSYREVQLGAVQNGLRVVEAGLTPGERIVVNGLQRIRPGDVVTPHMLLADGEEHLADAGDAGDADEGALEHNKKSAS
ncbi:efflux RND transporter periplasmic adaptor subunit [Pusillimonas noertemannii]|uniref:Multidrug efflux system membrane fusion protein n=1 Tax=Pusillimonas noertemannii TaxID=305977 RepID=A0A2U1CR30_9BURK|nr:efflux RND transporter periplasmic adaptor subunit [Pusillimonas noertemannii]NYT67657.1 efflux RND transporter periplasmic adaptor subunit [Pusillimonas noertemannii]PVY68329.1 multidrug efflux system membrane fusion protein [Pusillimonas noertemannii]TFL12183.1 efflux RND transporter periplasmic adaptor subunit [Pusillimonas noertemannii]